MNLTNFNWFCFCIETHKCMGNFSYVVKQHFFNPLSPSLSPALSYQFFSLYLFNFLFLILPVLSLSRSLPLSDPLSLSLSSPLPLSLCNYIYDFKMLVSTFLCIYVFSNSLKDVS